MDTAIVAMPPKMLALDETMSIGKLLAESGFFQDARQAAQAAVKVLAGQELGLGPIAAMTGINIIQGRVALSANLMAMLVKRSGKYDYRVTRMDATACRIEFYESGRLIGVSEFTAEDARKAGTKNMDRFPRNMLFARAMSNGVRWFCPDVTGGPVVYTPDELGERQLDSEVVYETHDVQESQSEPQEPQEFTVDDLASLRARILTSASDAPEKLEPAGTDITRRVNAAFAMAWPNAEQRRAIRFAILARDASETGYTVGEAEALLRWLSPRKAGDTWTVSQSAFQDGATILELLRAEAETKADNADAPGQA